MSLAAGSGTGVSLHVASAIFAGICGGVTLQDWSCNIGCKTKVVCSCGQNVPDWARYWLNTATMAGSQIEPNQAYLRSMSLRPLVGKRLWCTHL